MAGLVPAIHAAYEKNRRGFIGDMKYDYYQ
jgi:hypothetical protein